jgi:hypothetical protein
VTVGRVSQAASEALLQAAPKARLSQQATELLLRQSRCARLGQQSVEVLRSVVLAGGAVGRQPVLILCVSA